ncbi:hypothetical protein [Persephonella sp.]
MTNRKYLFYLSLSILSSFMIIIYIFLTETINYLEKKKGEIINLSARLENLSINIDKIIEFKKEHDIKPVTKSEAKNILIKTIDTFKSKFGANIVQEITDRNKTLTLKLSFTYHPSKSIELLQLVNWMEKNIYPVIRIEKFSIKNTDNGTVVDITAQLIQPYIIGG